MEYMTIQEAAEVWGISARRIQKLCGEGRLENAKKFGRQWAIPTNVERPFDARLKSGKYVKRPVCTDTCGKGTDIQMSINNKRSGIKPDDVLANINYTELAALIPNETYDFVDFFCGAGGMSYGFHKMAELTGRFRWAGAVDIDKHAIDTYERNYGHRPANINLGEEDIESIKTALDLNQNNDLILIGCAPCQGFSSHRKKDHRGPDSRNTLVGRFAEIAVAMQPKLIIMENVPDLLAKKHWHHYQAFKDTVEASGYHIAVKILNMADYGVPQARFRTVLLAAKDFVPTLPEPVFSPDQYRTVRDAIGYLPPLVAGEKDPFDPMHITSKHRKETVEILKQVPKNGGNRPQGVGPQCLDKVTGFYDVYGRLSWDKPAVTITARCRTPSCGRFAHPEQDRGLSVREAALLQGFPEDFYFEGPFDDKYKQIGNAVSPIFSTRLAGHVLTMLAGQNFGTEIEAINSPSFRSYSGMIAHSNKKRAADKKQIEKTFRVIDCFCGAGGLSFGFEKVGFQVVYAFDLDEKAIDTYKHNSKYHHGPAFVRDIYNVSKASIEKDLEQSLGEIDVVIGGPPCQGFSVQRRGDDSDPRNQLVLEYVRLLKEIKPKFFVMENVKGILSQRGAPYVRALFDTMTDAGYSIQQQKLTASDFGVPQDRTRVIIVGRRDDVGTIPFIYPEPDSGPPKTVRDAIADLMERDETTVPNHKADRLSGINLQRIQAIKEGEGRDSLPEELQLACQKKNSSHRHLDTYGRMSWDQPSPTITARFDSFSRGRFGHPMLDRTITLREGARLQSFPDDFEFLGSKVEIARQIGNAVPPVLAERIAEKVKDYLELGQGKDIDR